MNSLSVFSVKVIKTLYIGFILNNEILTYAKKNKISFNQACKNLLEKGLEKVKEEKENAR